MNFSNFIRTGIPISVTLDRHKVSEIVDAPNAEIMTSKILISTAPRVVTGATVEISIQSFLQLDHIINCIFLTQQLHYIMTSAQRYNNL